MVVICSYGQIAVAAGRPGSTVRAALSSTPPAAPSNQHTLPHHPMLSRSPAYRWTTADRCWPLQ